MRVEYSSNAPLGIDWDAGDSGEVPVNLDELVDA